LNYCHPHPSHKTQRDFATLREKVSDLMEHVAENNALFCPKEQVIIYNTQNGDLCADVAKKP
jgi:hypothetical protein